MHRVDWRSGVVFRPRMIGAPTRQEMVHTTQMVSTARVLLEPAE